MTKDQLAIIRAGNLEEVIAELQRQRNDAEQAAALFLTSLHVLETERPELWRHSGVLSFDMFLTTHHLCEASRYREYCAGLAKLGGDVEMALRMGEGAVAAARIFKDATPEKAQRLVARVEHFENVNGTKPSEQYARGWVREIDPREPKVVAQSTELTRLRAENQELRAKLKAAERKIRELQAKLGLEVMV